MIGNLRRASSVHAHLKDTLHNGCRFGVNQPGLRILLVLDVAVRNIGGQRYATFTLCFLHSTDFATGIFGEIFIEPVFDTCHVALGAVHVDGIVVVIDGDISNTALRECDVDIQSGQCRVSSKSRQVFGDDRTHTTRFDLCKHPLEIGTIIEINTAVAVIHEECGIWEMILLCVLQQDHFLRLYRIRLVCLFAVFTFLQILNRQSAIKGGNFVCCS